MKKFFLTCFYSILTLGISCTGFLLPSTLSAYQDEQIFSRIEQSSIEPMEFTYSSSLQDTLRLITSDFYLMDYPAGAGKRSQEEIYKIVSNAVEQLEDRGISIFLPEDTVVDQNASLKLAISSDYMSQNTSVSAGVSESNDEDTQDSSKKSKGSGKKNRTSSDITTAALWNCSLYSSYGYWAYFMIDDESGKIVTLSLYTLQTSTAAWDRNSLDSLIKKLAKFLQEHVGLQAEAILQSAKTMTLKSEKELPGIFDSLPYVNEYSYLIQLKIKSGSFIQLPVQINTDSECLIMNNLYF